MDRLQFKFYNLNITKESKKSWENDEIKNPRLSLRGIEINELTIDEAEEILIESVKSYFNDLRNVVAINEFKEAKLIMPAFQMCSTDKLDVIDFGFNIINPEGESEGEVVEGFEEEYIEEESISDWNHPSEMWEEFAKMMEEEYNEEFSEDEDPAGSYTNPIELEEEYDESELGDDIEPYDEEDQSQDELDFIKKKISGED